MNVSLLDEISKTNGIIGVTMSDPFSKLLLSITGSRFNAVGCYYHSQVYGNHECYVNLYTVHDGSCVKYLSNTLKLNELVTIPNIEYVTIYPFRLSCNTTDSIDLDTIFRAAMFELVMDRNVNVEWSISCNYLLLRYLDLHNDIAIPYVTGFQKINKLLCTITSGKIEDIDVNFDLCTNYDVLELSKVYHIQELYSEYKSDHSITLGNMKILMEVFTDLFFNHENFRSRFTDKLNGDNQTIDTYNTSELDKYIVNLTREMLIDGIVDVNKISSLASRILSDDDNFNPDQLVDQISVVRTEDANYEDMKSTSVRLRDQIQTIVNQVCNHDNNTVVVNLNKMIYDFNLIAEKLSIDPIQTNLLEPESPGISNSAILVLGNNPRSNYKNLPHKIDKRILVPTYANNLTTIPVDKLYDLLRFLDSLESADNHHIFLQNNIVKELAERKKKD